MSPRTKEQNEIIRKQRKQEILQAAIRVYVDKGYVASEMSDIAVQAGLAHGLVYYYFKNKKALFRELYEYMMEESKQYTKTFFQQEGSAYTLFESYARIVCERVLENPVTQRFYMRISLDVHHLYTLEEFSPFEWIRNFMSQMTLAIEKGIQQGAIQQGDANLMAVQFWGSVSQGMNYLDQIQQELTTQGIPDADRKDQLKTILDQVVESAISLFKPK
ncbi:TetR family transcriptional regulator [Paenibacillus marchantiophytorum]|uniref:TetR family transcriptional regulator n=1 Tax=Paenibacillus marchantiophytorum TaxID=1619310 RepID=A0ABQ1FHR6_9BACL|nr:TetR/AcrR family transcriptional regulator [Paenibacillus marchantiophytorum]GGA11400.1 TetR family transcriptional regulator [Paenibacillus marchantiophytorum]